MEIKVRGVNRVTARGRVYYYHRATGKRIKAPFGTPEFLAEIRQIENAPPELGDTFGDLVTAYKISPEFIGLAPRTKADYNRVFDYLEKARPMPARMLSRRLVLDWRDGANAKHGRSLANYIVAVVSLLSSWGELRGWCEKMDRVPKIARPKDAPTVNRPWTDHELSVVLNAAPPQIALAVALAAYTGLRESDVLKLPWSAYDGTAIAVRQGKTGEPVWIPAHRDLRVLLDAAEKKKKGPIIVTGERGSPYTPSGFRAVFFRLLGKLKEARKIGHGLTFHGLRHTVATRLAEAGCDDQTIMSVTGHKSASMVQNYTKTASRKRQAGNAIRLLERNKK